MTGDQIQFVTYTRSKKLMIEWVAVVQADAMRGTFVATRSGLLASLFGKKIQSGEWQCAKERFPLGRRLKALAKVALGAGALLFVLVGLGDAVAFLNSGSAAPSVAMGYTPNVESDYDSSYSDCDVSSSSADASAAQPYDHSRSKAGGYAPRVSSQDLSEVGIKVYDAVIDSKRVDVKGHYRGETYIQPYDRQPPGGIAIGDKVEAGAVAVGVIAAIQAADYLIDKFDPEKVQARKQAEEKQRAESLRLLRDDAKKIQQKK